MCKAIPLRLQDFRSLSTCLGSLVKCGFPASTAASSWEPSWYPPSPSTGKSLKTQFQSPPLPEASEETEQNPQAFLIHIPASAIGLTSQCSLMLTGDSVFLLKRKNGCASSHQPYSPTKPSPGQVPRLEGKNLGPRPSSQSHVVTIRPQSKSLHPNPLAMPAIDLVIWEPTWFPESAKSGTGSLLNEALQRAAHKRASPWLLPSSLQSYCVQLLSIPPFGFWDYQGRLYTVTRGACVGGLGSRVLRNWRVAPFCASVSYLSNGSLCCSESSIR